MSKGQITLAIGVALQTNQGRYDFFNLRRVMKADAGVQSVRISQQINFSDYNSQ